MTARKPKVGDVVEVVWRDAVVDSDERRAHEFSELPTVSTFGVLLAINDKLLRVAGEVLQHGGGDVTYRAVTSIPRPWKLHIRSSGA